MSVWKVLSYSQRQTKNWGKRLARRLEGGEIIGLEGELGTGKTCFARGVAEGLQVEDNVWIRSPTFTLINEYQGRLPVYHIDLYRVSSHLQQQDLDLREYFYGDGVSLVEWFEYLPANEVEEWLQITFVHGAGNQRTLLFSAHGERYERILQSLKVQEFKGAKTA